MEDITYIALIDKATQEGHKAAKISQDKIANIRTFRGNEAVFNPAPKVEPAQPVAAPVEAPKQEPVAPVEIKEEPAVVTETKTNNYAETKNAFMMECYKNDEDFLGSKVSLESARKLRVNPTVTKHILLMKEELGVTFEKPITNEVKEIEEVQEKVEINEEPKQETISVKLESNQMPNVDDYLQQGSHVNIDDIDYAQLSGAELSSLIDRVTDDLNKTEQANQHKREEQDRLNKTMVLKDLVEKLKVARAEEKALNEDMQQGKSL